jgi:hypothetical protein
VSPYDVPSRLSVRVPSTLLLERQGVLPSALRPHLPSWHHLFVVVPLPGQGPVEADAEIRPSVQMWYALVWPHQMHAQKKEKKKL